MASDEREAVVAWLRQKAGNYRRNATEAPIQSVGDRHRAVGAAIDKAANAIERGDHLRTPTPSAQGETK